MPKITRSNIDKLIEEVMPTLENFVVGRRDGSGIKHIIMDRKIALLCDVLDKYTGHDLEEILSKPVHGNNISGYISKKLENWGFSHFSTSLSTVLQDYKKLVLKGRVKVDYKYLPLPNIIFADEHNLPLTTSHGDKDPTITEILSRRKHPELDIEGNLLDSKSKALVNFAPLVSESKSYARARQLAREVTSNTMAEASSVHVTKRKNRLSRS